MLIELANPTHTYFKAGNDCDTDAIVQYFAADANLRDEGRELRGRSATSPWKQSNGMQLTSHRFARHVETLNDYTIVTATVSGAFVVSPLDLQNHFKANSSTIQELEICA